MSELTYFTFNMESDLKDVLGMDLILFVGI